MSAFAARAAVGPAASELATTASTRAVQRGDVGDDLVDESDAQRTLRVEPLSGGEQRARMRLADLGQTNVLITAGMIPSRVSVKPKVVSALAITMSATAHSPIPPPSAAPWTRATTGTGQASMAVNMACMAEASRSLSSSDRPTEARIHSTSAPAQKTVPSPARTTPRRASGASREKPSNVARSSAMSSASKALRTSGRFRRDARNRAVSR